MHHLLLGIDPIPLGSAPFALATDRAVRTTRRGARHQGPSRSAGLRPALHRRARRGRHRRRHPGRGAAPGRGRSASSSTSGRTRRSCSATGDRLLAASSPTGPAFEGAQISGGQRAAPGAIERVRIDREHARAAVPGHRLGAVVGRARLRRRPPPRPASPASAGRASSRSIAELFLAGVITADGIVDGELAARTPRIVPDGRTFSYVLHDGRAAADRDHPERRPRDPAGQGRAVRRASGC